MKQHYLGVSIQVIHFFRTPDTVLDAITDAGIDFLATANNHSLDSGEYGMLRTIEQLNMRQIPLQERLVLGRTRTV